MINFNNLTRQELSENGLTFATSEEADLFAQTIKEELEVRIGSAISQGIETEKLEEFDLCRTQEEATAWLEKNRPDYKEIVRYKQDEMNREILEYRDRIPGVTGIFPTGWQEVTIEELDLSVRSFNCLKRAGLRTVSDLLAYGDLTNIRNLGYKCAEEIKRRLWEISSPQSVLEEFDDDFVFGDDYDLLLNE